MQYRKTQYGYVVVLAKGEEVIASLTEFAETEKIAHAAISGLGAVEDAECCYYHLPNKEYLCQTFSDAREVLSLTGNIAIVEGKPFVHAHVVLGDREMQTAGGHLKEAIVAVTLEIAVAVDGTPLGRQYAEDIGLKLLKL